MARYRPCFAGAEPYPGISPWKLPNVLLKGYRIPKPEYVKEELYVCNPLNDLVLIT